MFCFDILCAQIVIQDLSDNDDKKHQNCSRAEYERPNNGRVRSLTVYSSSFIFIKVSLSRLQSERSLRDLDSMSALQFRTPGRS